MAVTLRGGGGKKAGYIKEKRTFFKLKNKKKSYDGH